MEHQVLDSEKSGGHMLEAIITRRKKWHRVLQGEIEKWSAMSYEQIMSKLPAGNECFQVEFESNMYQVEVSLLEDTCEYLQVVISVDDGTLPASFRAVSSSIICKKGPSH